MMRVSSSWWVGLAMVGPVWLAGCGGSKDTAAVPSADTASAATSDTSAPAATSSAHAAAADEGDANKVPTNCAKKSDFCAPPAAFVQHVCERGNSDIALYMLRKGTPFTRAYLTHDTNGWNADGGASENEKLVFDEEVVVLSERKADAGGMQVSGASGSYLVMRWNGACVSLQTGEVTFTPPPKAKHAKIDFHGLDSDTKDALVKDDKINKTNNDRRNECKGATSGNVSAKCEKLVAQLGDLVYDFVSAGGEVPAPAKF